LAQACEDDAGEDDGGKNEEPNAHPCRIGTLRGHVAVTTA
jgi:hypothetical protein